jgi:hypothetical protein
VKTFLTFAFLTAVCSAPMKAATETELKDDAGKTIIRYVVEPAPNIAPAGTKDLSVANS